MPRRLLTAAVLLLARGATGEGPGPPECRPFCGPGHHCTNSECAACGYCKNTGLFGFQPIKCEQWCGERHCGRDARCRGCLFCPNPEPPEPLPCEGWCLENAQCKSFKCSGCEWCLAQKSGDGDWEQILQQAQKVGFEQECCKQKRDCCPAPGQETPQAEAPRPQQQQAPPQTQAPQTQPPPQQRPPEPQPARQAPAPGLAAQQREAAAEAEARCYALRYPDLASGFCEGFAATGCRWEALRAHYREHGESEGRQFGCGSPNPPPSASPPPPPPPDVVVVNAAPMHKALDMNAELREHGGGGGFGGGGGGARTIDGRRGSGGARDGANGHEDREFVVVGVVLLVLYCGARRVLFGGARKEVVDGSDNFLGPSKIELGDGSGDEDDVSIVLGSPAPSGARALDAREKAHLDGFGVD